MDDFEERWEILLKYDPDVQAAAQELEPLGNLAIEKLKKAYKFINDPRKLPFILKTIKDEYGDN